MNDLFQDLWHDLREKRLWPVAVALAVAIVALPVVLLSGSSSEPASTAAVDAASSEPTEQSSVKLDTAGAKSTGTGSSLGNFHAKDPFAPPSGFRRAASATVAVAAGDTGSPAGGSGDAPSDGGSSGGTPPSTPVTPAPAPRTAEYEYVADVTFWNDGRRREIRGLRKLDMLPNQAAPVLIFMGVTANGGNAVFLVDSTLKTAGEGRCKPSASDCAFVDIGPGSEQAFSNEAGDSYRVRIDEIRRVKVKAEASSAERRARPARTASTRRFTLPALTDLVVETGAGESPAAATEKPSSIQPTGR